MHSEDADSKLLKLLAVAIIESPRATLQELAESVGISKATLHRCYGTRDNLEKLLLEKSGRSIRTDYLYFRKMF